MNTLNVLYDFVPFIVFQNPLLNSSTNRKQRQTCRHTHTHIQQTVGGEQEFGREMRKTKNQEENKNKDDYLGIFTLGLTLLRFALSAFNELFLPCNRFGLNSLAVYNNVVSEMNFLRLFLFCFGMSYQ